MMSPARTLSGRPSPFLSPSAAPAAPPSYMLGGGHMLVSTVSEAQAFDDFFLGGCRLILFCGLGEAG